MKKTIFLAILRHVLTFGGGLLAARGSFDADFYTELTGVLVSTVGGVWSIIEKYQARHAAQASADNGVLHPRFRSPRGSRGAYLLALTFAVLSFSPAVFGQTFVRTDDYFANRVPGAAEEMVVTETNRPTLRDGFQQIIDALFVGKTNWFAVTYALYAPGVSEKWGGGVGVFYPVTDYFLAGVRVDYLDGGFWMPSGNATIQVPLRVGKVSFTPFGYAGVGVPINLPGESSGSDRDIAGIIGYGLAVKLYGGDRWGVGLIGDVETWTGFPGQQYRFGAVWNLKF